MNPLQKLCVTFLASSLVLIGVGLDRAVHAQAPAITPSTPLPAAPSPPAAGTPQLTPDENISILKAQRAVLTDESQLNQLLKQYAVDSQKLNNAISAANARVGSSWRLDPAALTFAPTSAPAANKPGKP